MAEFYNKLIGVLIFAGAILFMLSQTTLSKYIGTSFVPTDFYKFLTMGIVVMVAYALIAFINRDSIKKKDIFMLVIVGFILYWLFTNVIDPLILNSVAIETQSVIQSIISP